MRASDQADAALAQPVPGSGGPLPADPRGADPHLRGDGLQQILDIVDEMLLIERVEQDDDCWHLKLHAATRRYVRGGRSCASPSVPLPYGAAESPVRRRPPYVLGDACADELSVRHPKPCPNVSEEDTKRADRR